MALDFQDLRMLLHPNQPENPFIEYITGFHPDLRYIGLIGEGGEGRVYLIEELVPNSIYPRFFARKVLRQEEAVPRNEVRNIDKLASSAPHPNLVHVFRHGFLTSAAREPPNHFLPCYFLDMELGRSSLEKYIRTRFHSPIQILPSPAEVWNILSQLASAVEFMHKRGVLHRDIKPDNLITSWSNPDLWKLTDFGISVISSGYMMSTRIKQGSDQYIAPEILRGHLYGGAVDVWGIGCLLYETFAGHRIFNNRSDIEAYEKGKIPLPQLAYPYPAGIILGPAPILDPRAMANQFAFRVLSGAKTSWSGVARNQVEHFWKAFQEMPGTCKGMMGEACADVVARMREINDLLKWMLDCDPARRPSVQTVVHHFRGFYLRSMLENDEGFRNGVVESLINPTRKVGGIHNKDVMTRWQFVIKLEAICAGKNRLQFYKALNLIAKRFIAKDFDDPDLNRELLELLSQKFELCTEFKRIYVYGLGSNDQDRQAIAREINSAAPPPPPALPNFLEQTQMSHRKALSTGSIPPYLHQLGSIPLERNLSEQSTDSTSFRMRKMSLDDDPAVDAPRQEIREQYRRSCEDDGEEEEEDDEESVDGGQEEQSPCVSGLNSLQHSLYQSQLASGRQSLQQSLHGSFIGNQFVDENEGEWVCLDQSAVTHHEGMDINGGVEAGNGV